MKFKTKKLKQEYLEEKKNSTKPNKNKDNQLSDDYWKYVYDKTEEWAETMETELNQPQNKPLTQKKFTEIMNKTINKIDTGMSGFQYGIIVRTLSIYWAHGDKLRDCHNKQYGVESDKVVNPSIIVLKTKE